MWCGLYGFLIIKPQTALHYVMQCGHVMQCGAVYYYLWCGAVMPFCDGLCAVCAVW